MLTFHNKKSNKLKYVNRMKAHIKADELLQKATGEGGKGCAVWCTLDKYDHAAFETEGIGPEWLARLYDSVFELQTPDDSKDFALKFLPRLVKHSRLKKHKLEQMICYHRQRLSVSAPAGEAIV